MTYETYDLGSPRPPRQTRNVAVKWRTDKRGVRLECECGWASPPTDELADPSHGRRLAEHIDFAHDPSSNPRRNP